LITPYSLKHLKARNLFKNLANHEGRCARASYTLPPISMEVWLNSPCEKKRISLEIIPLP